MVSETSERVKTGIPGLDGILHGVFIPGSNVLVSGGAGTGKTIFCMQFLYSGAMKYGDNGVFVTLEERPKELRREATRFGWNFEKLQEEEKLIIVDAASSKAGLPTTEPHAIRTGLDINALAQEIYRVTKRINARRIVIDSVSGLGIRFEGIAAVRNAIFKLSSLLRELGATSIMTSEVAEGSTGFSRYGVEEYVTDGIIFLSSKLVDNTRIRQIEVVKARGTNHSQNVWQFEITQNGIEVQIYQTRDRAFKRLA